MLYLIKGGDKMSIGKTIQKIRKQKGFTQKELAEKAGIAEITIRQYETEKRQPKIDNIIRISNVLGVPMNDLVEDDLLESQEETILPTSYKDTSESLIQDIDPDIRRIQRARKDMPEKDKKRMMDILELSMREYFSDDYIDDDTDE